MTLKSIPAFNPQIESAISRFNAEFIKRYGRTSVFVTVLADLWTIAMSKMLLANNMLESNNPIILIAENDALEILKIITHRSETLTQALFQEPFGFVAVGAIQESFEKTFGVGTFAKWLEALQKKDYGKCINITE